ncbi:MAG: hypothetical protein JKY04_04750 [Sneathiella sp.]|nr:hypothetical protein [Sneathiella sp.]
MTIGKISRAAIAGFAGFAALGAVATASTAFAENEPNDLINATLWTQTSVEFKASSMAAFKLAEIMLDRALANKDWTAALEQGDNYQDKPPAIILDVDETVLDNSEYEAWLIKAKKNYSSKTWLPYINDAISNPIPGSKEFINYAISKGVEIFYLSNRKAAGEEGTRKNLKKFGYPINEKFDTVLLRGEREEWGSAKGTRRAHVAKDYRVLMLLGDNMGDFIDARKATLAEREEILNKYKDNWSSKWIMIANPMYGSWEGASFGYKWRSSDEEKRQMKMDAMRYWKPKM